MELSNVSAAFFLRFNAEIDPSMTEENMDLFDQFSASPVGCRLLIRVHEWVKQAAKGLFINLIRDAKRLYQVCMMPLLLEETR